MAVNAVVLIWELARIDIFDHTRCWDGAVGVEVRQSRAFGSCRACAAVACAGLAAVAVNAVALLWELVWMDF